MQAVFTYRYTFLHNFLGKLGLKVIGQQRLSPVQNSDPAPNASQVVHLMWHTSAMAFMIFGLYATIEWHHLKNQPELYSLHSWLGVSLWEAMCIFFSIHRLVAARSAAPHPVC